MAKKDKKPTPRKLPQVPRVGAFAFLKEVRRELSKVIWPTRKEALRLTAIVVGVSVAVGIFIGSLDIIFVKLTEILIK